MSLVVLLVARESQHPQAENYVVTQYNRDNFSLPYVAKEHVPTWAFVVWTILMGFLLTGIEIFVVRYVAVAEEGGGWGPAVAAPVVWEIFSSFLLSFSLPHPLSNSSGSVRHRIAYGINLLFTLMEAFFVALSLTEFAKHWIAEPRYAVICRGVGVALRLTLSHPWRPLLALSRPDFIARCLGSVTAPAQYNPDGSIICTHPLGDGERVTPGASPPVSLAFTAFFF